MIRRYVDEALRLARHDKLDDGSFCAEVPRLRGVIAVAPTFLNPRGRDIGVDLLARVLRQAGVARAEWTGAQ